MGILQRYVMGEVARSFGLALLTITGVFVLFMIMAEATKMGLSPRDILNLVPYVIPGSLPYTVPVSMLFAVTVVFGRLASDNEVVAVKTAGLSALTLLKPAFYMGLVMSGLLLYLSSGLIPRCNQNAKLVVFKNMEEMFYKFLKKDREFNNPRWPFLIKVRNVEGKVMTEATFKHRVGGLENPNTFDAVIQAKKAIINFDVEHGMARVYLDGAEIFQGDKNGSVFLINDKILEMPLPEGTITTPEKKIQECSNAEMVAEQAKFRYLIAKERRRQALAAALWIGSGRVHRVDWKQVARAFIDYRYWEQKLNEFETEKQMRTAMACGSFFFVLLGAPVGILFARRDFLSAFITCFLPIILVYYPLTLFGVNMGKDGLLNPTFALWIGNSVLALLAGFLALPPVMKH